MNFTRAGSLSLLGGRRFRLLASISLTLALICCSGIASAVQSGSIVGWGSHVVGVDLGSGFIKVAAGDGHSLALKQDGSIVAWGRNDFGQCSVPAPNTGFVSIAAGVDHSLGLKSDGSVVAWGRNGSGQCNVPAPNTGFTAIATRGENCAGLKTDASIVLWGNTFHETWSTPPSPNSGFTALAVGTEHGVGLRSDGSISCWGYAAGNRLNVPAPNSGFVAIAGGHTHSLGLKADGSVVGWGTDQDYDQRNVPAPNSGFVSIAAGRCFSVGVKSNGSVVAWGTNTDPSNVIDPRGAVIGQLDVPAPNSGFVSVAAGRYHCVGLKSDGSVVAWGWNEFSQCNLPSENRGFVGIGTCDRDDSFGIKDNGSIVMWGYKGQYVQDIPQPNRGYTSVSGGYAHALALRSNGVIAGWGWGPWGQAGPIPAPNSGFVSISSGYGHSLGLRSDGSVAAWGDNRKTQCNVPSPNSEFAAVSGGFDFSMGLKRDGSIVAWGSNDYGQRNVPAPNSGFVAIAAGGYHGLGLKSDGSIVAWGRDDCNQCVVPIPNSGFTTIDAGLFHSIGLKTNGSVVAWGDNTKSQCVLPTPNSGFISICASAYHNLAIRGITLPERESVALNLSQEISGQIDPGASLDYKLNLQNGQGPNLVVRLTPDNVTDGIWYLRGKKGTFPTLFLYDWAGERCGQANVIEMLIPATSAGEYFFSVTYQGVAGVQRSFKIEAIPVERYLSFCTPNHAASTGHTNMQIRGMPFVSGMQVQLLDRTSRLTVHDYVEDENIEPTRLFADLGPEPFDAGFSGIDRDVQVRWPSGNVETLYHSFFRISGMTHGLQGLAADVILPKTTRLGRKYVMWIEYWNQGDSDMPAPILVLKTTSLVEMSFSPDGPFSTGSLLFLAVNFNGPAGILPPGVKNRIPIYFIAKSPCEFSFGTVGFLGGLDPEFSSMQDYLSAMSETATRLTRRGEGVKYQLAELDAYERSRRQGNPANAISGTVFNEITQTALWNVKVQAIPEDEVVDPSPEATTNDTGHYVVDQLSQGTYDLHVPGYFMPRPVQAQVPLGRDVNGVNLSVIPIPIPTPDPCSGWGAPPSSEIDKALSASSGDVCINGGFDSKKLASKMLFLKLVGDSYEGRVSFSVCGTLDGCKRKVKGSASGSVETPFEGFAITGKVEGEFKVDPIECLWVFTSGSASLTGSATKKYPIGMAFLPPSLKFLDVARFQLAVSASMGGSGSWKEGDPFPGMPSSGSFAVGVSFSAVGSAESYVGLCKGSVTVTGSVNAILGLGNTPSSVQGCATFNASGSIGHITYTYTAQQCETWAGGGQQSVQLTDLPPDMQVNAYIGLPTRFGPNTVLLDIENDLQEDGEPSLAVGPSGTALCVWTKDRPESDKVGSSVVAAEYTGGTWSSPVTVAPFDRINSSASVVFDSSGEPWALWSSAPTVDSASTSEEINNVFTESDVYYSHREGGVWSAPLQLSTLDGCNKLASLAAGKNGLLCAAWVNSSPDSREILASIYDGNQWSAAQRISSATASERPTVAFDGPVACVVWTEEPQGCAAKTASSVLMCATHGSHWSDAQPVYDEPRETQGSPSLAVDEDGVFYLAWQEAGTIRCATGQQGLWSASYTIPDSTGSCPRMASRDRKPFVIYGTGLGYGNDSDIVYSAGEFLPGVTPTFSWTAPVKVSPSIKEDFGGAIASLPDDRMICAWLKRDASNEDDSEVYYEILEPSTTLRPAIPDGHPSLISHPVPIVLDQPNVNIPSWDIDPTCCVTKTPTPTRTPTTTDTITATLSPTKTVEVVLAKDPNEKAGPIGSGSPDFAVPITEPLEYTIYFENQSSATAATVQVTIADQLSENLDWSTFEPTAFGWANRVEPLESGYNHAEKRYVTNLWTYEASSWVISGSAYLDITASVNLETGKAEWTFTCLDMATEDYPEDAYAGFLPPECAKGSPCYGRGQGYVSYRIRPRTDIAPGYQVSNAAIITFEYNAPIVTNTVLNTIVAAAPAVPDNPNPFDGSQWVPLSKTLDWDDAPGAASYDLYLWQDPTPKPTAPTVENLTSSFYHPVSPFPYGKNYLWQVVAKNTGNSALGDQWSFKTLDAATSTPTLTPLPTPTNSTNVQNWTLMP